MRQFLLQLTAQIWYRAMLSKNLSQENCAWHGPRFILPTFFIIFIPFLFKVHLWERFFGDYETPPLCDTRILLHMVVIGARDKGTGGGAGACAQLLWKFGQMLGKIKNIWIYLPEYMLNSGFFISILRKNLGKLSTAPPPPPPPRKASAPYAYDDCSWWLTEITEIVVVKNFLWGFIMNI
jgi:hypothetical protein